MFAIEDPVRRACHSFLCLETLFLLKVPSVVVFEKVRPVCLPLRVFLLTEIGLIELFLG